MKQNNMFIISYMQLRALIGFLGIALPVLCVSSSFVFSQGRIQDSISMYYYTNMRDIFVGVMICASFFFITYKGYNTVDNSLTNAIGIAGFCVAVFPCRNLYHPTPTGVFMLDAGVSNTLHLSSAGIFFLLLAINSIFIFTRSSGTVSRKSRKYYRNVLYIGTGIVILLCLALFTVLFIFSSEAAIVRSRISLIIESIMLFCYGVSWIVKGGTLLKDRNSHLSAISGAS